MQINVYVHTHMHTHWSYTYMLRQLARDILPWNVWHEVLLWVSQSLFLRAMHLYPFVPGTWANPGWNRQVTSIAYLNQITFETSLLCVGMFTYLCIHAWMYVCTHIWFAHGYVYIYVFMHIFSADYLHTWICGINGLTHMYVWMYARM
jgi:hypothetical protein